MAPLTPYALLVASGVFFVIEEGKIDYELFGVSATLLAIMHFAVVKFAK